jgi:hypothetical protein
MLAVLSEDAGGSASPELEVDSSPSSVVEAGNAVVSPVVASVSVSGSDSVTHLPPRPSPANSP